MSQSIAPELIVRFALLENALLYVAQQQPGLPANIKRHLEGVLHNLSVAGFPAKRTGILELLDIATGP